MSRIIKVIVFLFLIGTSVVNAQQPDPSASIAGKTEGKITIEELLSVERLIPNSPDLQIVSFTMSYFITEDDFKEFESDNDMLIPEMKDEIKKLKPGIILSFENIMAKRGNEIIILQAINLEVK
jgi:hypothetical protein